MWREFKGFRAIYEGFGVLELWHCGRGDEIRARVRGSGSLGFSKDRHFAQCSCFL